MREMPFQGVKFQKFFGGHAPEPLQCALPCFDVPSKIPGSAPETYNKSKWTVTGFIFQHMLVI